MSDTFDNMEAGEDGWTEWVHPLPGYLMKCCGCGLVHEMEARPARIVEKLPDGRFEFDDLNPLNGAGELVVMMRMKRRDDLGEKP